MKMNPVTVKVCQIHNISVAKNASDNLKLLTAQFYLSVNHILFKKTQEEIFTTLPPQTHTFYCKNC